MALYTLADLHLATDVAKPMDIFGGRWEGHTDKIIRHWRELIAPEDTVVLGGDISWGISLAEAKGDFALIDSLPGRKIILKGNHDLWWETASKMHRFLDENGFASIDFLHNNCFFYGKTALCGTRGWPFEEDFSDPHNEKIFRRELLRLEASLRARRRRAARGDHLLPALSAAVLDLPLRGYRRTAQKIRRKALRLWAFARKQP